MDQVQETFQAKVDGDATFKITFTARDIALLGSTLLDAVRSMERQAAEDPELYVISGFVKAITSKIMIQASAQLPEGARAELEGQMNPEQLERFQKLAGPTAPTSPFGRVKEGTA